MFDKNNTLTFVSYPHTINLNDLIIINDDSIKLDFNIVTISEVKYPYTEFEHPYINNSQITFFYPGTYRIFISDGIHTKSIMVCVNNLEYQSAKIYNTKNDLTSPKIEYNTDGSYNLYLPVLFYLDVYDYYYLEEMYQLATYPIKEHYYDNTQRLALINSGRIQIEINSEIVGFVYKGNNPCIEILNLSEEKNDIEITYYYQGFNGEWTKLTQKYRITCKIITTQTKIEINLLD